MKLWAAAMLGVLAIVSTACSTEAISGRERAVSLTTTACGHASQTSGAGVIVEDGWVVASGHVVSGAGSVEVFGPFGQETAEIVAFDADADLSLLWVPSVEAPPIEFSAAVTGATVALAGGGPSGFMETTISRPVEVRIEAVRSTERISRFSYELTDRVLLGDSGGGVFDRDNRLVGIVYGRSLPDSDESFIVRHEAVEELLAVERDGSWSCDAAQNRIVVSG